MISHLFKKAHDTALETYPDPRVGVWTHAVSPSEEELNELVALYALDESIVADINDIFEVPRFEQEGSVSYFFTRYPYDVKDIDIETAPILFVLGETFFITIAQHEVPFLKRFLDGKGEFATTQRTELFLEFLSALIVSYEHKLTRIRKMVYRDMGRIRSIRARDIQRLVFLEQELNEVLSALVPMNTWLQQLTKGNYIQMFSEDRELLEDLLIANIQLIDSTKSILKTIQNIRTASEAILTQNLNHTIRMLTAFTIVLTIPTLVSSLFGMNVPVPLQNSPFAFWAILLLIIGMVGVTIYFFMRNRWL